MLIDESPRELRFRYNLKQADLAELTEINQQRLSRLERGVQSPTAEEIKVLQMVSYDDRSLYVSRRRLWPEEEGRFRVSRPEAHLQYQHAESRCPGICDHGYHWTFNQGNVRPV